MVTNVYFDLTEEFNAEGLIALLAPGPAVAFYRWSREERPDADATEGQLSSRTAS